MRSGTGQPCGVKGRAHDFIVTPDGRFVHGQLFTHLLVYESGIEKYQVIQEETTRFRVRLLGDNIDRPSVERRIRSGARSYLGSGVKLEFEYPDEMPPSASGKHRWIVSRIAERVNETEKSPRNKLRAQ